MNQIRFEHERRRPLRTAAAVATVVALALTATAGAATASSSLFELNTAHSDSVESLRLNGLSNPLGIGASNPVFSWINESDGHGAIQTAYQIRVAESVEKLGQKDVWSPAKVNSAEQLNISYAGPALSSQKRYAWQVRTWNGKDKASDWSEPASFETGVLNPAEWQADWIGGADTVASQLEPWTDYSVDVNFHMDNLVMGMFGRATDSNNAYMWQISLADGTPRFRPHVKKNGQYSLLESKDISSIISKDALLAGKHDFRVQFEGSTIIASLDGVEIDRRVDTTFARGTVGFRASSAAEGQEQSTIYSINAVKSDGTVLLSTDFSDGKNPFEGGSVVDGAYKAYAPLETTLKLDDAAPLLRKDFSTGKQVASARIYASALGVYELSLNGEKIGDQYLAPGWTDYNKKITYQTYDVTDKIDQGTNSLGAMLGDGWYAGYIASFGPEHYGKSPSLLAQLRIDYTDGTSEVIKSDSSWKSVSGPLTDSDMIMGETYDAAKLPADWDKPSGSTDQWLDVEVESDQATALLTPQTDEPVRVTEERSATLLENQPTPGAYLYDMKQNMVGVPKLTLSGVAGQTVTIRYGEMLQKDGSLYTANLRSAKATDYYTFAETGTITYQPKFTFHGYRYMEVSGVSTAPDAAGLKGLVLGTDNRTTGTLKTSDSMLNQLQSNITWGQRGNFLSVPTDTPARDERLGWTGDINVFAPTASYNQDTLNFLGKWLGDMRDAQMPDGDFPGVAPAPIGIGGGSGWADASVTVAHTLWKSFGDTKVVEENYASMAKFIDFVKGSSPGFIRGQGGYGDWLHLDDHTDQALIGTAYFAYDARLMSQMAAAIGKTEDAAMYAQLEKDVTAAFQAKYLMADGMVSGNSQTGYSLAIGMGLVPQDMVKAVGEKLVAKVAGRDYHLSTGFIGTPWLLQALTASGHVDVAFRLLNNKDYPSWGYEVESGATTMWERWDSLKPDGSFGDVGMNSFNHYAYGAVGDWMYQNIGGISASSAGYKTSVIAPIVGGGLTSGEGNYDSVYGKISSKWTLDGSNFALDAEIPANTTSVVKIAATSKYQITVGGKDLDDAEGVTNVVENNGIVEVSVGSGSYSFVSNPENVGVTIDLETAKTAMPGDTVNGIIKITNTSGKNVQTLHTDLTLSGGLVVSTPSVELKNVKKDETREIPVQVAVPKIQLAGPVELTAVSQFTGAGDTREFVKAATLFTVGRAITIAPSVTLDPAGDPAAKATVTSTLANAGTSDFLGHVEVDVPDGWAAVQSSAPVTVPAGGTADVVLDVPVPLTVNEGSSQITVRFVTEGVSLANAAAEAKVTLARPPAAFTDHVDFGNAASETAHAVKGSASSGTSLEAGLTRRYSNVTSPGSYFEYTANVTPGQGFVLRATETYDRAQIKEYSILVNGVKVHSRLFERTEGGAGIATYQVVIPDDGTLTSTGKVVVRFEYTGVSGHYDPSIADSWIMDLPAGTAAPAA